MPEVTETYSLANLEKVNILQKMLHLLGKGWIIDPKTGKLTLPYTSETVSVPWVYTRKGTYQKCGLWHRVMFDGFGVIPSGCMECYKVVVRPRTLKELFQLYELQEEHYDGPCKCGFEKRPNVHGNYGGYFYNVGVEDGRTCYATVRRLVDELISPDVPVILKRACTEYEAKYGDSDKWEELWEKNREDWEFIEKAVEQNVYIPQEHQAQTGMVKVFVMRNWLDWAYDVGDETAREFNSDQPFYKPYVTYHEE